MLLFILCTVLFFSYGFNMTFFRKAQGDKVKTIKDSMAFMFLYSIIISIIFALMPPYQLKPLDWNFMIYPVSFSVFIMISNVLFLLALNSGPTSVTTSVGSFKNIIPVIFSIIFLAESVTIYKIIAIIVFALGLVLANGGTYKVEGISKDITPKWLTLAVASTLIGGCGVIFSKISFGIYTDYIKEYLLIFAIVSAVIYAIPVTIFCRPQLKKIAAGDIKFWLNFIGAGIFFAISNNIFCYYVSKVDATILFPALAGLGIISYIVFGRIFLKEKISKIMLLGCLLCAVAVILTNF